MAPSERSCYCCDRRTLKEQVHNGTYPGTPISRSGQLLPPSKKAFENAIQSSGLNAHFASICLLGYEKSVDNFVRDLPIRYQTQIQQSATTGRHYLSPTPNLTNMYIGVYPPTTGPALGENPFDRQMKKLEALIAQFRRDTPGEEFMQEAVKTLDECRMSNRQTYSQLLQISDNKQEAGFEDEIEKKAETTESEANGNQ